MESKKILIGSVTLVAMFMGTAQANNDGPGCGLGQQVWAGKSGLSAHTSAATTNGTLVYNQLFGISSGTLGCNPKAVVTNDYERKNFVASNMDNLSQDIAQGQGAHLDTLATLMGIADEDRSSFFQMAQGQYANLFRSTETTSTEMLASLDQALLADATMAKYVK